MPSAATGTVGGPPDHPPVLEEPDIPVESQWNSTVAAEDDGAVREIKRVSDLTPDRSNANAGTPRGRAMVETSMRRYGFGRSVLVDKKGRIIAGNTSTEVAVDVGLDEEPPIVVRTDGKRMVVVQRTDLDLETDNAAKELALADNRTTEVGLKWDPNALIDLKDAGVAVEEFFLPTELDAILEDPVDTENDATPVVPDMELLPFEEYDYVVLMFRNSQDWQQACEILGLQRESWTDGTVRKVGLGRVLDGARVVRMIADPSFALPKADA